MIHSFSKHFFCICITMIFVISISCKKKSKDEETTKEESPNPNVPALQLPSINNIHYNSATCQAPVNLPSTVTIVKGGFCWDTLAKPDLFDLNCDLGANTAKLTYDISNLLSSHKYYVRAYIVSTTDTIYSPENSFNTLGPWQTMNNKIRSRYEVFYGYQHVLYAAKFGLSDSVFDASTDGGATWHSIRNNHQGSVNCLVGNHNFIFSGGSAGMWRSDPNGNSWVKLPSFPPQVYIHCLAALNGTIFAGSLASGGLYMSKDDGNTWNKLSLSISNSEYILSIFASGNTLFAGTNSGIYSSENNGETWSKQQGNNLQTGFYANFFGMIGKRIFLGSENYSGILYSDNNGSNWFNTYNCGANSNTLGMICYKDNIYFCVLGDGFYMLNEGWHCHKLNEGIFQPGYSAFRFTILDNTLYALNVPYISGPICLYSLGLN